MHKPIVVLLFVLSFACASPSSPAEDQTAGHRSGSQLWAGLNVNQVVFLEGDHVRQSLNIGFALANDLAEPAPFDATRSQILVNGEIWDDTEWILSNGPGRKKGTLEPGAYMVFGYALGERFTRPGVYRVSWRGANFRSNEIEFRVVAQDARIPRL